MDDRLNRRKELLRKKEALKAKMAKLRSKKTGGNDDASEGTPSATLKLRQRLTEKQRKKSVIEG